MTITCLPIDVSAGSPAYTAQNTRQAFSGLVAGGTARPIGAQSGLVAGHAPTITASSTTWSVGIGAYIVDPAFTTTQSPYFVANDAAVTGSMTAAHATLNRYDILYLQVNDTAIDSSGSRNATINYLAGTAASTPLIPTLPARSIMLAYILVPFSGGGSPVVTLYQRYAVASGGVLPVIAQADRDSIILAPYEGYTIYRQDTNSLECWNGSAWDQVSPLTGALYGEVDGPNTPTTMVTNGVVYVPGGTCSVTVTLATTRRLRIVTKTLVTQNTTATGRYQLTAAYNSGSSVVVGSVVRLGTSPYPNESFVSTVNGSLIPMVDEHSVLLTAGTYTFYPAVSRVSGGTGSDSCSFGYTAVYDAGAV